jgi:hypothetical protein
MIVDIVLIAIAHLTLHSGNAEGVHKHASAIAEQTHYFDSVHQVCCSLAALGAYWTD